MWIMFPLRADTTRNVNVESTHYQSARRMRSSAEFPIVASTKTNLA